MSCNWIFLCVNRWSNKEPFGVLYLTEYLSLWDVANQNQNNAKFHNTPEIPPWSENEAYVRWKKKTGRFRRFDILLSVGIKLSWGCQHGLLPLLICWQWVMFHKINGQSSGRRVISAVWAIREWVLGSITLYFHSWQIGLQWEINVCEGCLGTS